MKIKNFLLLLELILCAVLTLKEALAFNFEYHEYNFMHDANLVFGSPNTSNRDLIQKLSSKNSTLITWTRNKPDGTYLHPIVINNVKGENFVNCLFYDPNSTSTLITDFYMEKMLKSVKAVKFVFLTPLEFLQMDNKSFATFLEWIARIIPDTDKFEGSMMFLVTGGDSTLTLETTLDLLSKVIRKLPGFIRPELLANVNKITKGFLSKNIRVVWEPEAVFGILDTIPFENVLPTDVNLVSSKSNTTEDEFQIISTINEVETLAFKNAIAQVEIGIPFMNEENFSGRLQSLRRMKTVFIATKEEMMTATNWNQAADILDKNLKTLDIILEPSFKKNVSIGHDLILHIKTATGRSGQDLKESISQISFHPLIMKTFDYMTKYSDFLHLYTNLVEEEGSPRYRQDSFENFFQLLSIKNVSLDSAMANRRKSRDVSESTIKGQEGYLLPQEQIHGTGLLTNTVYKIHLIEGQNCFLAVIAFESPNTGCPIFFPSIEIEIYERYPKILCSAADRKLYESYSASWFLQKRDSGYVLTNLEKGKLGFFTLDVAECSTYNGFVMSDLSRTVMNASTRLVPTQNLHIVQLELNANRVLVEQFDGKSRANLSLNKITSSTGTPLKFTPDLKIESKLSKFQFEKPEPFKPSKKDFADNFEIVNNGPGTLTRKVTLTEAVTDTYSLKVENIEKYTGKVTAKSKFKIPLVGETEVEIEAGFELTKGKEETNTGSKTKTFEISYELSVPPNTTAHISAWYEKVENIKLSFTVENEVTGISRRITKYNDVIDDEAASGGDIAAYLRQKGLGSGKIIKENDFSVVVEMVGEMTASVGLEGNIGVESSSRNSSIEIK